MLGAATLIIAVSWACLAGGRAQIATDAGTAQARQKWSQTKKQLEAAGLKFGLEQYSTRTGSDKLNFAAHSLLAEYYAAADSGDSASSRLREIDLEKVPKFAAQRYLRPKYDSSKLFSLAGLAGALELDRDAAAREILQGLSSWTDLLDGVVEAASRPTCRFPLSPERPGTSVAHSVPFRIAKNLHWRALARIQLGEDGAAHDMTAMLQLTEHASSNQSHIGLLITIAINTQTTLCLREGMALERWNEAQLASFEQQLAKLDFGSHYSAAGRFELAYNEAITRGLIEGKLSLEDCFGAFVPEAEDLSTATELYQQLDSNARATLELFFGNNPDQPCLTRDRLKQLEAFAGEPAHFSEKPTPEASARAHIRGLYIAGLKCIQQQAVVNLARTAIAIERYRLQHGKTPQQLDALVPVYLDRLPGDPITSRRLQYQITKQGSPLLYSFGWDGDDDGGLQPELHLRRKPEADGDWIWPTPTP